MKYEHAAIAVYDGEVFGVSQLIKEDDIEVFTDASKAIEFLGSAGFRMCGVESNFKGVKNMTRYWFVREIDTK